MDERVYLVTGAAGFLGGTIVRRLVEQGKRVRAFVLKGDPAIKFLPDEAEVVEGNLVDIDSIEPLFAVPEGTETVMLHIASFISVNPDFDQRLIDINVGGAKNIIELCLRKGDKLIVSFNLYYTDTACAYFIKSLPVTEGRYPDSGLGSSFQNSRLLRNLYLLSINRYVYHFDLLPFLNAPYPK